jgi:CheY-like chemotaxis protein
MPTNKKRILCVDDDSDNCELVKTYLGLAGYEVITASTISEGLRLAQEQHFDLYLIELRFPEGSGADLARRIHSFDPKTPLVFHSASAYAQDIQEGMDAGAQAYITKPSDPLAVIEIVKNLINAV